jgi:hypothetical protein
MAGKHPQTNWRVRLKPRLRLPEGHGLTRAQPRVGTVVPDEFTPRPRASSGSGRPLGTPKAQLGQASLWSNLGQTVSPTDRFAGALNAGDAWRRILTHAPQSARPKWPQSLRPSSLLSDMTGKQRRSLRSDCRVSHPGNDWQQVTINHRVQPRAQLEAPPRPTSCSGLGRRSPPRPTLGSGLGRRSPPRPTPGLGLDPGLGRNHVLARSRPRPQVKSLPRPTLGSDWPR